MSNENLITIFVKKITTILVHKEKKFSLVANTSNAFRSQQEKSFWDYFRNRIWDVTSTKEQVGSNFPTVCTMKNNGNPQITSFRMGKNKNSQLQIAHEFCLYLRNTMLGNLYSRFVLQWTIFMVHVFSKGKMLIIVEFHLLQLTKPVAVSHSFYNTV